jgi:hypothetical protein
MVGQDASLTADFSHSLALQLTAARARSLVFEGLYPARSRQLNANPLGRTHAFLCQAPVDDLSRTVILHLLE